MYGQAVWVSAFVRWDDGMLVYENPAIRAITPRTLFHIFSTYDPELYIPLTFFSYQIDYLIGGIQPFQYHFTSFLLHTFNAVLVAWFAMLFFAGGRKGRPVSVWAGLFCGALFLLHPLHTEAVMWVSGRKDVLSTFFFLLTLIYWIRLRQGYGGQVRWREEPIRKFLVAAVGFFALALLSKVMAITLPIILLLLDWRDKRRFTKEMFTEKIPFFALAILFGLIGVGGKTEVVASSTLIDKILMGGKSSIFYIQKILWPDFFSLLYPYYEDIVITSPDFYIPIIAWAVILAFVLLSLKRTRDIAFGLLFYLVTVGPTFLNFTKGGDLDVYFASDRYAYAPSIGIFIALIGTVLAIARPYVQRMCVFLGVVVLSVLAILSYRQSLIWRDTNTLLMNVLRYYPQSHVARNNIANVYRLEGRYDEAIKEFEEALTMREHPRILSNLGAVYRKLGEYDLAIATYERALEIDPNSKEAHFGLGIIHAEQKNYLLAEAEYLKAIAIDPRYEEVHTNLGVILIETGRIDEAIESLRTALAVNPFFVNAHYNLGLAYTRAGRIDDAIAEYEEAVREVPNSVAARINLGLLLHQAGDVNGAIRQFKTILTIDPNNASAKRALQQLRR